jgi:hypothetical protein
MEAEMSEAAIRLTQSVNGGAEKESPALSPLNDKARVSLSGSAEKYMVDIRHFLNISGELTSFLSELSEKIRSSAEQLKMIEQAVELKTEELKQLHNIEAAAAALEQLREDQRREKEQFEILMARQRGSWEKEKAARNQENEEYLDRLRAERQREEEAYRCQLAIEQAKAKQILAEELESIQKKYQANQETLEKDYLGRELGLKQKELEWLQLVQELERFMSKLSKRAKNAIAIGI